MAKKPKESTELSQRQKFINSAREIEADEDETAFEAKLKRIAEAKPPPKKPSDK